VVYVLLKEDEESNPWKELIMIITDHFQIWSFSFSSAVTYSKIIINGFLIVGFSMEIFDCAWICDGIFEPILSPLLGF
jgi:hypothetical protein